MQPLRTLNSSTVVLDINDIDTDQIIPARFLTTTERDGLGKHLFHDWRYRNDGSLEDGFVLNRPEARDSHILVAGRNFGCGSSREHAPWALLDFGLRAVVSSEIADIFRSNALKNGLLPVVVDAATHRWLLANPGAEVEIDVAGATLTLPDGRASQYPIDAFARYCLLEGIDQLGFLQQQSEAIRRFEETRPWKP
jgi:3-isopropylmalate/(R)-2-methylmalate dehydratase small subunit